MGNLSRMKYFDNWFKIYSKHLAKERGQTMSAFLSDLKDFDSFKSKIKEVFSLDGSLANYVEGMSDRSLELFYNRLVIQEIVDANKPDDQQDLDEFTEERKEFFEELEEETPVDVKQTDKEVEEFFKATFIEKETGKEKKVIAKKEFAKVRGKDLVRHRDSKGRFVKRV